MGVGVDGVPLPESCLERLSGVGVGVGVDGVPLLVSPLEPRDRRPPVSGVVGVDGVDGVALPVS